ncbi:hypothetical protein QYE76_071728 [Lolium multiflorum]|uniref:DUF4220 domain-containing protein n=1 Tax=Lolium multiflorum TaxID=4521 RepID=A0AAD8SM22_LOLMU|nr:hypothetical protein QYE76_071728 [Lolium multiflorum]
MAGNPANLWNRMPVQILVLLSLGLQILLFALAGTRRREGSRVRRFSLWQAYQTADYTAMYTLGHLSLSNTARDHPLVASWAPFLLLHLGGPDNISAYALEDNQLWLRHLQTLVVQVLGAAYVIYKNASAGSGLATKLMFAVGVVKYGERTWALRRGNLDNIRKSVTNEPPAMHGHFHPQDDDASEEERLVRRAHSLFHICKRAIVDSSGPYDRQDDNTRMLRRVELWALMELELSLMYDVLYTKAAMIHTWHGYCIRVASPLAIVASLLLFHFSDGDSKRSGVDVAITYVLFGGALLMEITSLVNALGSSWTFSFLSTTRWSWLRYAALCNERWDRLRRAILSLRRFVCGSRNRHWSRRWSGNMGQFNMIRLCTRPNTLASRWFVPDGFADSMMPKLVKGRISHHMARLYKKVGLNSLGMLRKKWGKEPLVLKSLYHGILKDSLGIEFQEGIIIWHIATDVFLAKSKRARAEDMERCVEAIKVLSNYMMFLLVKRPDMLPGLAQNRLYHQTCKNLINMASTSRTTIYGQQDLANIIFDDDASFRIDAPRLSYVIRLANKLLQMEADGTDSLELVFDVWTDIVIYAGNKCSRKSHAQKLNNGIELTTILWLMAEHIYQVYLEDESIT